MTLLERKSPELKALAEELGYQIHYRAKAYWAGSDIQLTYEIANGKRCLTIEDKIAIAMTILKKIKTARELKRLPKQRMHDLIELFKKNTDFPYHFFTEMHTEERDKLTILHECGGYTAWLDIIGEPKIKLKDFNTTKELLISLEATLESYNKKDNI